MNTFIEYFVIGIAIALLFVIGWITVFMLVGVYLENRFGYCHMMSDRAILRKDFDAATYYNEKLQTLAKLMRRVDRLLYFQFF
jgi:hypothetical protein